MKALILAAGFGNRMRPLTNNQHKTLLSVSGLTILYRIIDSLLKRDICDICVVTGYRSAELREYLHTQFPEISFDFVHNDKYQSTNNIYSLALAFESLSITEDILLIESDLVYSPEVLDVAISSSYPNVALVSQYRTGLDGTVVAVKDNTITSVFPPHLQGNNFNLFDKYKTLNIYKFSNEFCNTQFKRLLVFYAKAIDSNCYYELILGILIYMARETIYAEIVDNSLWAEVDDPNDLRVAEFQFNTSARLNILQSFGGYWNYDLLDFCFIRNMHFPPRSLLSEINNNLYPLLHNYGSCQSVLNEKMSYVFQCNKDFIVALNGASQVYPLLSQLYKDCNVLMPEFTFGEYPRWFHPSTTFNDLAEFPYSDVISKLNNSDLIVLVNPNQPSGTPIDSQWILDTIRTYPKKTFIVDESFIEFSSSPSLLTLISEQPPENLIIIKSMSKTHGLPGVRLGFVFSSNYRLIEYINAHLPVWNLNSVAEFFLEALLKNKTSLEHSFCQTISDREQFKSDLISSELFDRVYDSSGNYILVRLTNHTKSNFNLSESLVSRHSIFIKDVSSKITDSSYKYYRFAVRLPHENSQLIQAISDCLQS